MDEGLIISLTIINTEGARASEEERKRDNFSKLYNFKKTYLLRFIDPEVFNNNGENK